MRARIVAAVLIAGLSFSAVARAQMAYGASAGLNSPRGDFGLLVNTGYHITGLAEYSVPLMPFGFRGEASWSELGYKSSIGGPPGAHTRIVSAIANGMISPPAMGGLYVIGGFGIYRMTAECSTCTTIATKGGLNGGLGYRLGLGGISTFIEARYHYIAGPSDPTNGGVKTSNTQFIPVSVGVRF